ncbi:MAG: ThiF family adenylyltransferase, partial [Chitinophagales bacterium]
IVDFDVVDDSNLQRQVLFSVESVGQPKVEAAKKRLEGLNPHINFIIHNERLTSENALELFKDYDLVADGTDNFPTRYLVNDACVLLGKPNVYASIFRFEGQVSVFNYTDETGQLGPNYRDLFPEPPPSELVPNCSEGGVIGVLPGIIGSMQALEVIKVITGVGKTLSGRLFLYDASTFETRTLKVRRSKKNPLNGENPTQTGLIDYEQFCDVKLPGASSEEQQPVKEVTVRNLQNLLKKGADFQLIDVREPYEYEIVNIEGELIPLGQITQETNRISKDKQVIVHCRSGKRSADAIRALEQEFGYENLYNLKGGVLAYAKEIDTSLAVY